MTREEIIQGLRFTVDMFLLDPTTGETYTEPRNNMDKTTIDACRGAIELLEQEPCDDCISRQAVLDLMQMRMGGKELYKAVYDLPPVTPQPKSDRWIPVSERLPEDGRPVLIYAWNVHHVVARYDSFRTEDGYKKCWVTADAWNGNTEIKNEVIEWMPLPEPYKAE